MSLVKPRGSTTLASIVVCVALVAFSFFIFYNRQYIIDQFVVWQFQSTSEIDALVDRSGVNDYGKFLYHASRPVLDATQEFNNECDRIENTTSILGCYSNYRIYIYNVTDERLNGVREVTATHETLHAAYQRLGSDEKNKVNLLLEAEYKKLENDKSFSDRMDFYARTEPGERGNELHSVIGTEVSNIDSELEVYYKRYFDDRQKVVALNAKYNSVFMDLKNHADSLALQMDELSKTISESTAKYNSDVIVLNNDIILFNTKASGGGFVSQFQFNSARDVLISRTANLDTYKLKIDNDINTYNTVLGEYNSIASESKKLYDSIDSLLAPTPVVL
jgi:hypothetical protein